MNFAWLQTGESTVLGTRRMCRTGSLRMLEQENVPDLVADLERRIDDMQTVGDKALDTFTRFDWVILIIFPILLPFYSLPREKIEEMSLKAIG